MPVLTCCALAIVLLWFTGCRDKQIAVQGHVTAGGKPVESGALTLVRFDGNGKSFGAVVRNGEFDFGDQPGLAAGEYRATLEGFQATGRTINDVQRGPITETVPLAISDNAKQIQISSENAQNVQLEFQTIHSR
jgi:hypothetical protein